MAIVYRETWFQIQENRVFLLYMLIGAGLFAFIYYHTAKAPLTAEQLAAKSKDGKEPGQLVQEDSYTPPTNSNNKMTEYNMQNFANMKQQQYDVRDMGKIGGPPVEPFTSWY